MDKIRQKILEAFKDLVFQEEAHAYYVNGIKLSKSVSNLIDNYKNPFDTQAISKAYAKKHNLSQDEVIKKWDSKKVLACKKGHDIHFFGECYTFNRNLVPSNGYERAIVRFFDDIPPHIVPCLVELKMYHKVKMFAGTMDTLFYNTNTGKFIVTDFKTNEDLFKNFKEQKLKGIFCDLLDMPFNKYQIQLSFYQILLEQVGVEVEDRKIVYLRDGSYELFDCGDYTDVLRKEIEEYVN